MRAFFEMIGNGMMLAAYKETLRPLVIGIVISAVLGIGLGLWVGLNNFFDWLFSPIFIVMQAAPLAALIPLLVLAYGIGLTSKVLGGLYHGDAGDCFEHQWRSPKHT